MSSGRRLSMVVLVALLGCGGDSPTDQSETDAGVGGDSANGSATGGTSAHGGGSGARSGGKGGSGGKDTGSVGEQTGGTGGGGGGKGGGTGGESGTGGRTTGTGGKTEGTGGVRSTDRCGSEADRFEKCPVCADDAACDARKYTDNGDGTVTTSCCGLVWQQGVSAPEDTVAAYCANLALAGGGWRIPTYAELNSLVVLGQDPLAPTIDRTAFPDTPSMGFFWSTYDDGSTVRNVAINFGDGQLAPPPNSGSEYHYRCVR